ncbi:MAG: hypothetical protein ACD_2C00097G0013 [uncultured bacterium (gcode 4)]|uniref:Uncharacterized protein n=1 Tax=uncultured bacterium (gcode 4) TaxID=1234023 RepID=K2H1R7_9BACT|nr:MAG: hypothetical protein ACD_2C00097G0013 [uncultured bacterium (gcode 4)]
MENRRKVWDSWELMAISYLQDKWMKILETNHTIKWGEIDIIWRIWEITVFIEVKLRNSLKFWIPEEALTRTKKRNLLKTINYYCRDKKINLGQIRADFISIINEWGEYRITHHENIELY